MKQFPNIVRVLTSRFDAWIVGSGANPDNPEPRDWDVIVPFERWSEASLIIPKNATVNTFGGWKVIDNSIEVDVWPDHIDWIVKNPMFKCAWHPFSGTLLRKENRLI